MAPHFLPDAFVISISRRLTRLKVGDVVVANHPRYKRIIKRIAAIDPQGRVQLSGDNPASTSQEKLGWLLPSQIIGRVIYQIKPTQP